MNGGRCWTEIDLSVICENYRIYRDLQPEGRKVMAVVKADAYGHGDRETALALQAAGCTDFAVSNLDEAIRIRRAGVTGQILILGYTPVDRAEELFRHKITQALLSDEYANALAEKGFRVLCQYALDTGMRRIGLCVDEGEACERAIREAAEKLELTGLFTHLCAADTDTPGARAFTKRQIALFEEIAARVADLKLPYVHCMNSAGGLWHESKSSCFARLGIVLYGLKPDYANVLPEGIRPALAWKSVVSMVKTVRTGETVGYGRTYTAPEDRVIATVSCGYADGVNRLLSNRGRVFVNGKAAPIVGRVCMDQFMADVTGIGDVLLGTPVTLIGEGQTADDMAQVLGTIGYEIVCDISPRVERRYVKV